MERRAGEGLTASGGRPGHRAARAVRAAVSLSCSRVWLAPEKTSMSPVLALRTCTTIGSEWPASSCAVAAEPAVDELVAARAGLAAAAPKAETARPAAPGGPAPSSPQRRGQPRC